MNLGFQGRAGRAGTAVAAYLAVSATLLMQTGTLFGAETRSMRFDHLGRDNGLSQSFVYTIVQDREGYMWFGTQDGLNRFDGFHFRVFAQESGDSSSLSDESIRTMIEDSTGTLWVGTDAGGLSRFDRTSESFVNFLHDPSDDTSISDNRVRVIYEDSAGNIWVGTDGSGLDRLDRNTELFTHYRHDPTDSASISNNHVWDLLEDSYGSLWIATERGLNRLDLDAGRFTHYLHDADDPVSISDDRIRVLFEDSSGQIWIGTENGGLSRFDRATATFERFMHDPNDASTISANRINAIYEDMAGVLWIGTIEGLNAFDPGSETFATYVHDPADRYSLQHNNVLSLYQDRGGVLWVGTYDGLSKWNPSTRAMLHFRNEADNPDSLSENTVTSFAEHPDGRIWVGTFGGGLNLLDRTTQRFSQFRNAPDDESSVSSNRVMALLTDSDGNLWAGTRAAGLNFFDQQAGTFVRYAHDPGDSASLGSNGVTSLLERRDEIWVGTFGGGISILDRETGQFTRLQHDAGNARSLSNDRVLLLFEDSAGAIWIGTYGGGLNRYDPATGEFSRHRHDPTVADSLSGNEIYMIQESPDGDLWVGAKNAGLNRWAAADRAAGQARFEHFGELEGLPSDTVYSGAWDDAGHLWLSTAQGLSQFDTETRTFRNFDLSHGLQGEEYNLAAGFRTSDGHLLFGGLNGFNAFDPAQMTRNGRPPQIAITDFHGPNESIDLSAYRATGELPELDYKQHVVGFEYAALDYAAPAKSRYQYRLDGLQDEWVDAGDKRHVNFTNLPAGNYTFRVRAINNDGVWSTEGAQLAFSVLPPPWQTGLAYTTYIALALLVAAFAIRSHRDRVVREARLAYVDELDLLQGRLSEAQRIAKLGNWDWNIQSNELWWSDQVCDLFQRDPETFGADYPSFLECVHPDDRAMVDDAVQRALRNEEPFSIDHRIVRPDQTERVVHERAEVLFDDSGRPARMVGTVHDITDRKNAEDNLRHHAAFQGMLAGLSADLIRAQPHNIDDQVTSSLRLVGHRYNLDAVSIWWYADDRESMRSTYRWVREENKNNRRKRFTRKDMPWVAEQLLTGDTIVVEDVSQMPVPAVTDQKSFVARGIESFLIVPLLVDDELGGSCIFSTTRQRRQWPHGTVAELRLVAESLACAIARTRSVVEIQQLKDQLQAENFYLREEVKLAHGFSEIIGEDRELKKCLQSVEKVAPTDIAVLILGETGTGKELVARALHNLSTRHDKPMVSVNCPALPANLIESELFGHEKGAFTGADAGRRGRFELAEGGTLFLDEIGELPLGLQAKLLRVLQTGEYERLGGTKTLTANVRLVAATNRNLEKMIDRGEFRSDLYYRIASFPIRIPPLRKRHKDVPLLAEHFVHKHAKRLGKNIDAISANMIRELTDYDWPGNVRQLESIIERSIISTASGSVLELPGPLRVITELEQSHGKFAEDDTLTGVERSHIVSILEQANWRIDGPDGAAYVLGIPASTLRSKMKRLGISKPQRQP